MEHYESVIRGFWDGEIVLNLGMISCFPPCKIFFFQKNLHKMIGMDIFDYGKCGLESAIRLDVEDSIISQYPINIQLLEHERKA